jgi:hypothetical protein
MVKLSNRDLQIIAGVIGAADFYYEGALTAPVSRAIKAALARAKPVAARGAVAGARALGSTAVRGVGTVASIGKTIAMRHPVLTTGAVVYYTYKNREELGDLIEQGYEIIQPKVQQFGDIVQQETQRLFTEGPKPIGVPFFPKRKKVKTKFNKAVSKGMNVVKASTSYGKKGSISNAKKAFSVVTKTASKINKGAKVAKSGITRKIGLAIKGILK